MHPIHELAPGDEHPLAAAIRKAIGTGTYDRVQVVMPQFERTDGIRVSAAPSGVAGFDVLREIPADWLRSLGLCLWDSKGGEEHWLYPAEWYAHIPAGYEVVTISRRCERFAPGTTSDDRRGGVLAYGFIRRELP